MLAYRSLPAITNSISKPPALSIFIAARETMLRAVDPPTLPLPPRTTTFFWRTELPFDPAPPDVFSVSR